jgi:hypothetical protein
MLVVLTQCGKKPCTEIKVSAIFVFFVLVIFGTHTHTRAEDGEGLMDNKRYKTKSSDPQQWLPLNDHPVLML